MGEREKLTPHQIQIIPLYMVTKSAPKAYQKASPSSEIAAFSRFRPTSSRKLGTQIIVMKINVTRRALKHNPGTQVVLSC